MPTSSQSLILQTTNGLLPSLFGRQNKKPAPPPGPEWTSTDQPIYTTTNLMVLNDKQTELEIRRRHKQRAHPPRKRTGSAPHLNYKLDFGTLSQVLSVRGIHGSMAIDHNSNSFRWKVNSIRPFYERNRRQLPTLSITREPTIFRYTHADRIDEQYRWNDNSRDEKFDKTNDAQAYLKNAHCNNDFRRKEPFQSDLVRYTENTNVMSQQSSNKRVPVRTSISSHLQTDEGLGEYYKLMPVKFDDNDSTDGSLYATYELEKCSAAEVGSFRLLPTNPGDSGDFKLVPPSGFISDRFRLFASKDNPRCFILLESDDVKSGNYRPLYMKQPGCAEQIQEEHVAFDDSIYMKHKRDVYVPREAWSEQHQVNRHDRFLSNITNTKCDTELNNTSAKQIDRTENYFDEIAKELGRDTNVRFATPDINLNDGSKHFHNYRNDEDGVTCNEITNVSNQHTYHVESMHMRANTKTSYPLHTSRGTYAGDSQDTRDVNDRFNFANANTETSPSLHTSRGIYVGDFQDARNVSDRFGLADTNTEDRMQYNKWNVHDFDQWSRTRSKQMHQEQLLPVIPFQTSQPSLARNQRSIDEETIAKSNAVLNDVKFKASYKLWKKKKISTVRMRKELPASDPYAVFVKVDDGNMAHDQMKHSIEKEIGCKLVSLQFDPVLINSFQGDSKYRWILRFANPSICEALTLRGLHVDGVKRSVRRYDDVMREEYDAYLFYETMKDMERKIGQKTAKKTLPKVNASNTTEAQTATM